MLRIWKWRHTSNTAWYACAYACNDNDDNDNDDDDLLQRMTQIFWAKASLLWMICRQKFSPFEFFHPAQDSKHFHSAVNKMDNFIFFVCLHRSYVIGYGYLYALCIQQSISENFKEIYFWHSFGGEISFERLLFFHRFFTTMNSNGIFRYGHVT